jgi:hypothetical protein
VYLLESLWGLGWTSCGHGADRSLLPGFIVDDKDINVAAA